ncbi:MAG: cytochrome c biogenesis protein CcsA [Opitutaceae bacterium]
MALVDRQWLWMAAACYLAGLILGTISLIREKRHSRATMYAIIAGGYVLQTIGLALRGHAVHGCPLGNTFEFFQFTAWSVTTLYLLIGATFRLSMLGFFTSGLAAVFTIFSLSMPSWDAVRHTGLFAGNPWVALHAGMAMFSYGTFAMLALTSLLYLFRQYSLKHKHLGGWFSFLPSLMDLEQISLRLLVAGVSMMSASLIVGYFYWRLDDAVVDRSKLLAVISVWSCYAATLALRSRGRLVARRFAWVCAILFVMAMLSLWPVDRSRHPPAKVHSGVTIAP